MAEPITLSEAKTHLRVDGTDEDALISSLISAAREYAENYTGLVLAQREVTDSFDRFGVLELSGWPIADDAEAEVTYRDATGAEQTLAGARIFIGRRPARLLPALGTQWPNTIAEAGGVKVAYLAGFAVDKVPAAIKAAMLLIVGHLYTNRNAVIASNSAAAVELPMGVEALLRPYRLMLI